jgi:LAS superfamily LD-carboxypeptidase LdcB
MHGWGLAVDVAVGDRALSFSDPAYRWLTAHAALFGWRHPEWGAPTGSSPEPWHWEYEG